ncbi:MAG: hypothetical protein Q9170_002695 [Blastenia crenularia]
MSTPSPSLIAPMIYMTTLMKRKMENHPPKSASENSTLYAQLKQFFTALSTEPDINALIESYNVRTHWVRLGSLIEGWVKCEFNVAQQGAETSDLFKEVLASQGVAIGSQDGRLKVKGENEGGRRLAALMGFAEEGRCERGCARDAACTHGH